MILLLRNVLYIALLKLNVSHAFHNYNNQLKLISKIWSGFGLKEKISIHSNESICNNSNSSLEGVECQDDKIIGISLKGYGVVGTLSPSFGNLSDLLYINLNQNSVYGTIPSSFGYLKNLVDLELTDNHISGIIPKTIGQMTSLQTLDISRNRISGTIPCSIGNLIELSNFYAPENSLTGSIPSTIGLLTNLERLRLYTNSITNMIPSALGRLKKLSKLNIANNFLSGPMPSILGLLESLTMIRFDFNKFTGSIPSTIGYLTNLLYLNPSVNKLNGSIPSSLGLLSDILEEIYLNDNSLTGTIPQSLGKLTNLYFFDFQRNRLTGTFPNWIWNIESLTGFDIRLNSLTGTITSIFCNATNLETMHMGYNSFSGTLPSTISLLSTLTALSMESNNLIGTIPNSIAALTNLNALKLNDNSLTGTIPFTLSQLTKLVTIFLFSNHLTGSLPDGIWSSRALQYLNVYNNSITGTISKLLLNCTKLQRLVITDTLIYGTIPHEIGYLTNLQYLYLSNNQLTGTLPSTIGKIKSLQYLDLHSNAFHGTLPTSLSTLSSLVSLYLRNNWLEGPLQQAINTSYQSLLKNIDVSDNYLTGSIPSELFFSSTLEILAATSNCFLFPELVDGCTASKLQVLSLDGLRTSDNCRKFFWSKVENSKTYALEYESTIRIPDCFYTLPQLSVLHLSGNALTGTIPSYVVLGSNLKDLTLSYNRLHGTIPDIIQQRNWTTLDLSYNSLTGTLSTSIPKVSNGKLALTINRLSGFIPPSLLQSTDISILKGNIFQCDFNSNKLPSGDSDSSSYSCGSDTFLLSLYIFFSSLLFCYLLYLFFQKIKWVIDANLTYTLTENGTEISKFIINMCWLSFALTVYILVVMMPVYGALSHYYGTHTYQYAWSVSAGLLSGRIAIVIMLVVWSVMLILFLVCYYRLFKSQSKDEAGVVVPVLTTESVIDMNPKGLLWDNTVLTILFIINIIVVFGANAAYVFTTLRGDANAIVIAQILLGMFKLLWRYGYIEYIGYYRDCITGHTHRNKHELLFLTLILIINNVVLPVFSEVVVDTNCIYNMFVVPDAVTSSYSYDVCLGESFTATVLSVSVECLVVTTVPVDITYTPPFIYRYQCSATIITNYVSVYCYMYVITALQIPLSTILVWFRNAITTKGSRMYRIISLGIHQLHEDVPYLNYPLYVAGLISSLAILVTFGAAFPPLAAIIMISMYVDAVHVTSILPQEVPVPVDDLRITIYLVPFSAVFFCFFLYDASDYQKDIWSTLWAPFVILLIPIFYYIVIKIYIQISQTILNYKSENHTSINSTTKFDRSRNMFTNDPLRANGHNSGNGLSIIEMSSRSSNFEASISPPPLFSNNNNVNDNNINNNNNNNNNNVSDNNNGNSHLGREMSSRSNNFEAFISSPSRFSNNNINNSNDMELVELDITEIYGKEDMIRTGENIMKKEHSQDVCQNTITGHTAFTQDTETSDVTYDAMEVRAAATLI